MPSSAIGSVPVRWASSSDPIILNPLRCALPFRSGTENPLAIVSASVSGQAIDLPWTPSKGRHFRLSPTCPHPHPARTSSPAAVIWPSQTRRSAGQTLRWFRSSAGLFSRHAGTCGRGSSICAEASRRSAAFFFAIRSSHSAKSLRAAASSVSSSRQFLSLPLLMKMHHGRRNGQSAVKG
jgi:hypothetical protein